MYFRLAVTAGLAFSVATPAFADYWIVRTADRKCEIVEEQPDIADQSVRVVGQQLYVTREAAEEDMQVACRQ
jgi:hypothetical protein